MSKESQTVEDIFGNVYPAWGNEPYIQQRIALDGSHHVTNPPLPSQKKESIKRFLTRMVHRACYNKKGPEYDKVVAWLDFKFHRSGWSKSNIQHGLTIHLARSERSNTWGGYTVNVFCAKSPDLRFHNGHTGTAGYCFVQKWTQEEAQEHAFHCMSSGFYFDKKHHISYSVEEIGDVSHDYIRNYYKWTDGTYHSMSETWKREMFRLQTAHKTNGSIPAYHSLITPWRALKPKDKKLRFGIELEMFATNRRAVCDAAEKCEFLGEQDSSLDHDYGIEIIAEPVEFEDVVRKGGRWDSFLDEVKKTADPKDPPNPNYGMHISISRKALSHENQVRFVCFINKNHDFCKKIGGRNAPGYASYNPNLSPDTPSVLQMSRGHTFAVNVATEDRIEVRLFKYNYRNEVLFKNVEFLDAVIAFTKETDNDHIHTKDFLRWFDDVKERYPNLNKFLQDEKLTEGVVSEHSARDKMGRFVKQAQRQLMADATAEAISE